MGTSLAFQLGDRVLNGHFLPERIHVRRVRKEQAGLDVSTFMGV